MTGASTVDQDLDQPNRDAADTLAVQTDERMAERIPRIKF
jgi:hypothetical protein